LLLSLVSLFSLSFFLHCFVGHLYLLSFPTRRSSDLLLVMLPSRPFPKLISAALTPSTQVWFSSLSRICCKACSGSIPAPIGILIDRKSTRLNSSHVSISYAVFCLKKKKTKTPAHTHI